MIAVQGLTTVSGQILAPLDEAGIRCRGKRWSHSAVRSVLRRAGHLAEAS